MGQEGELSEEELIGAAAKRQERALPFMLCKQSADYADLSRRISSNLRATAASKVRGAKTLPINGGAWSLRAGSRTPGSVVGEHA